MILINRSALTISSSALGTLIGVKYAHQLQMRYRGGREARGRAKTHYRAKETLALTLRLHSEQLVLALCDTLTRVLCVSGIGRLPGGGGAGDDGVEDEEDMPSVDKPVSRT